MKKIFLITIIICFVGCKTNGREYSQENQNKESFSKVDNEGCSVDKNDIIINIGIKNGNALFTSLENNLLLEKASDGLTCIYDFNDWKILHGINNLILITKNNRIGMFNIASLKFLWEEEFNSLVVENGKIIDSNNVIIFSENDSNYIQYDQINKSKKVLEIGGGQILDVCKNYFLYAQDKNDFSDIDVYKIEFHSFQKILVEANLNIELLYAFDGATKLLYNVGGSSMIKDINTGNVTKTKDLYFQDGFYPIYHKQNIEQYSPDKHIFK